MKRFSILCLLALVACSRETPPPEPIVMYAYEASKSVGIEALLTRFTAETGIPVSVHYGDSTALTDDIINQRASPPADALLTAGVVDIWRAADEGALRPIQKGLDEVQGILRDPDGFWVATMVRTPMLVAAEGAAFAGLQSYRDLGKDAMRGRLCLASSALPGYRALVAMLIETEGNKPAERMIRNWMRNLALPPFDNEADLLQALGQGTCEIGLVASGTGVRGLMQFGFQAPYFDIDGLGVGRHAVHADAAQNLVEWMIEEQDLAINAGHFTLNAGVAGFRNEEARLLAERVGYR